MSKPTSPYEVEPPTPKRLLAATLIACGGAVLALITFVLPAEYGIDPSGLGSAMGLTAMGEPSRTIEITDVIGGNESYRNVEIPDFGDPVPLPNPNVYQDEGRDFATKTVEVELPPEGETEVKLALEVGKMILFKWKVNRGDIYVDFHGHDPEVSNDYWVRYKEQQEGSGNEGSLVAPFTGEHGWYWLNYNDFPVTITLTVSGYFDDIIDYGLF
jgi:hypothetical protein